MASIPSTLARSFRFNFFFMEGYPVSANRDKWVGSRSRQSQGRTTVPDQFIIERILDRVCPTSFRGLHEVEHLPGSDVMKMEIRMVHGILSQGLLERDDGWGD